MGMIAPPALELGRRPRLLRPGPRRRREASAPLDWRHERAVGAAAGDSLLGHRRTRLPGAEPQGALGHLRRAALRRPERKVPLGAVGQLRRRAAPRLAAGRPALCPAGPAGGGPHRLIGQAAVHRLFPTEAPRPGHLRRYHVRCRPRRRTRSACAASLGVCCSRTAHVARGDELAATV
eukprot:scaffold4367_cov119-Isochrysis_galbana.AAC.3